MEATIETKAGNEKISGKLVVNFDGLRGYCNVPSGIREKIFAFVAEYVKENGVVYVSTDGERKFYGINHLCDMMEQIEFEIGTAAAVAFTAFATTVFIA